MQLRMMLLAIVTCLAFATITHLLTLSSLLSSLYTVYLKYSVEQLAHSLFFSVVVYLHQVSPPLPSHGHVRHDSAGAPLHGSNGSRHGSRSRLSYSNDGDSAEGYVSGRDAMRRVGKKRSQVSDCYHYEGDTRYYLFTTMCGTLH
jgi:hypothetical protein